MAEYKEYNKSVLMFNCVDNCALKYLCNLFSTCSGADPGFQVRGWGGGAHLKKLRRAEGGAKIFGVFRVKNHDFTPKKSYFSNFRGTREIFGVFHVKNHDFTPKKSYFFQF